MVQSNEKKWFVYVGDHHEGPFSVVEIQAKIGEGVLRNDGYVWADGMQDWKPMAEVPEFNFLFAPDADAHANIPHALLNGEVSIGAVDHEGLPTLEVPIQTMMEQTLTGVQKENSATSSISAAPGVAGSTGSPASTASIQIAAAETPPSPANPIEMSASTPSLTMERSAPVSSEAPTRGDHSGLNSSPSLNGLKKASRVTEVTAPEMRTRDTQSLVSPKPTPVQEAPPMEHVVVMGRPSKFKRLLKFSLFLGVVGGIGYAYTQGFLDPVIKNPAVRSGVARGVEEVMTLAQPAISLLVEKVPILAPFFSPIPTLTDVSQTDYDDLRTAASTSLSSVGPAVGAALATGDLKSLHFYVSSNLPDGAAFTVHLEGVPDSLLNATEFSSKTTVTVTKHLGQSKAIVQEDGTSVPKGDYKVYVYEAEQQSEAVKAILDAAKSNAGDKLPRVLAAGKKVAASKVYFLGGPKDKTYTDRLKEYHDRVRTRASLDFEELNQTFATLVAQYNASYKLMQTTREKLGKVKSKGAKGAAAAFREWTTASGKWLSFQNQIGKFDKWTPDYLKASFYPSIYAQMKRVSAAVIQFHQAQALSFAKPQDAGLEAKVDEVQKATQGLFYELGPKIKKIQESLKTGGVPARVD